MPRIEAETVVAHRRRREEKILAAARALLLERGPGEVTPGAVAKAVGLTRTAIYKYFASRDDILRRIVDDSFTDWLDAVENAVDAADPAAKVDVYVRTTLALGTNGAHRIAVLAGGLPSDVDSRARLAEHHRRLTTPLATALEQQGIANPALVADLVDGVLGRAIAQIDSGTPGELVAEITLGVVKRALDLDQPGQAEGGSHELYRHQPALRQ